MRLRIQAVRLLQLQEVQTEERSRQMQISVRRANSSKVPRGLHSGRLEPETSAMIQQEAIEVFTAMVNSGRSFQHALQAVFLSGMNAAREAMR